MELMTKKCQNWFKNILVVKWAKNYTAALQENRFLPEWSFFSPIFGDFVPKVLNKSLVTFDICFAKFFHVNRCLVSCEGDSGNCSGNWMQISGK